MNQICDNCGKGGAQLKYVTRSYGKGATLLVIENVPVIVCPQCGESYMTAHVVHEIARIKQHRHELAAERPVAVASFA